MAQHRNPSIGSWLRRIFNFKTGDMNDSSVGEILVPTISIVPNINIVRSATTTVTGSTIVFTTPTDKDFYLTTALLGFIKDATADTDLLLMRFTIGGVVRDLLLLRSITLTADSQNAFLSLPLPLKIDRGTSITMSGTFTLGAMSKYSSISGYTVEVASSQGD